MIKALDIPLVNFVRMLEHHTPFAFARYGDGEWYAILGDDGESCDGHPYYPENGADLRASILARHSYLYALGPMARHGELGPRVEAWLMENDVHLQWYDTEVFLKASIDGALYPLIQALRTRSVLYVGPAHLRALVHDWFGADFVEVPLRKAYLSKASTLDALKTRLQDCYDVVGFSAGPLTDVIISELWPVIDDRFSLIDFGSVFDIYAGVASRKYMRDGRDWKKLASLNRNGRVGGKRWRK